MTSPASHHNDTSTLSTPMRRTTPSDAPPDDLPGEHGGVDEPQRRAETDEEDGGGVDAAHQQHHHGEQRRVAPPTPTGGRGREPDHPAQGGPRHHDGRRAGDVVDDVGAEHVHQSRGGSADAHQAQLPAAVARPEPGEQDQRPHPHPLADPERDMEGLHQPEVGPHREEVADVLVGHRPHAHARIPHGDGGNGQAARIQVEIGLGVGRHHARLAQQHGHVTDEPVHQPYRRGRAWSLATENRHERVSIGTRVPPSGRVWDDGARGWHVARSRDRWRRGPRTGAGRAARHRRHRRARLPRRRRRLRRWFGGRRLLLRPVGIPDHPAAAGRARPLGAHRPGAILGAAGPAPSSCPGHPVDRHRRPGPVGAQRAVGLAAAGRQPVNAVLRGQLALRLLRPGLLRRVRGQVAPPAHVVAGGGGAVLSVVAADRGPHSRWGGGAPPAASTGRRRRRSRRGGAEVPRRPRPPGGVGGRHRHGRVCGRDGGAAPRRGQRQPAVLRDRHPGPGPARGRHPGGHPGGPSRLGPAHAREPAPPVGWGP